MMTAPIARTKIDSAIGAAQGTMSYTGSVGSTHREERVTPTGLMTDLVVRVDRRNQYHVRATQTHAPGTLAAKLADEAKRYEVRTSGTGRPGWVSVWQRADRALGFSDAVQVHDEHRDSRIVQHYVRLGIVSDPLDLLSTPDSSD